MIPLSQVDSVSVDQFRTNLSQIMGRVMYGGAKVVIKKYNTRAAVLLSMDEYEELQDPSKRLSKKQWNATFKEIEKVRDRVAKLPKKKQVELARAIDHTILKVRGKV